MGLPEHLEKHLGLLEGGWKSRRSPTRLFCARFPKKPVPEASTYVTMGLSDHVLSIPEHHELRQELVFAAYDRFAPAEVGPFLRSFAEFIEEKHRALLGGDVVGPSTPLVTGVLVNSVLAYFPTLFEDAFGTFDGTDPPTALTWVVPLHEGEANHAHAKGWRSLENLFESKAPDLLDLLRPSVL